MSEPRPTPPAGDGNRATLHQTVAEWMQAIAPYGIFTTDAELRIQSWNQWLVTHSGFAREDVIGRPLLEVFPDLDERRLLPRFTRALAGEISLLSTALHRYLLPFRATMADPSLPFMLQTARIAPLPTAGGIGGTITIIEDVTQRESQAAFLRRQQELDRLLSAALAALLQSRDPAQDIARIFTPLMPSLGLDAYFCHLWNAATQRFELQAAAGVSPKQREGFAVIAALDAPGKSGGPEEIPLVISRQLQAMQHLGLKARYCGPLSIGIRSIGFVSFGSYARDSVGAENEGVLFRVAHFLAIALDRNSKEREALAASRAKDDFLAALSHELRTPLNPVLLVASDSANNPDFPAAARAAFRAIEKNAQLEARLIDDLLDLTRIEHGKLGLDLHETDAHAVLLDALATVRTEAEEKGLGVDVDLRAPAPTVTADPARLQQVFWNVLKNGVKFTPAGGRLRIASFVANDGQLVLEVADTGIGMEAHELKRVFNAFAQGDHAAKGGAHRFGGLGLGLAICRKLVELHHGHIEASSEGRGRGTTFRIVLPPSAAARFPDAGVPVPAHAAETEKTIAAPTERSLRILLVEDHEPTRAPLASLLVRRGYAVVAVGSGAEALTEAGRGEFDLVLSDIGLPDIDGFALMRQLSDAHGLHGVALTGYGMEADIVNSTAAGFVAHLTKPINIAVLDRTLRTALGRT